MKKLILPLALLVIAACSQNTDVNEESEKPLTKQDIEKATTITYKHEISLLSAKYGVGPDVVSGLISSWNMRYGGDFDSTFKAKTNEYGLKAKQSAEILIDFEILTKEISCSTIND